MDNVQQANVSGSLENKDNVSEKLLDLDDVLEKELGQFGRFQLTNILLVAIPLMVPAFMTEFIFSASAIPHRCRIPECGENNKSVEFNPIWLANAVPRSDSEHASCNRYNPLGDNGTLDNCPVALFDQEQIVDCDIFVYERDNTIVYDFDLGCKEWLRAQVGLFSSVGALLSMPLIGYFSDRFGRRLALTLSIFNVALFGLIRAFSFNYTMYLVLQFLNTTLGGGTFTSAYICAAELVGPKYRMYTSVYSSSMFALGQVTMGAVASLVRPWRYLLISLNIPSFLLLVCYFFLSESVRWLLSKQKYAEARRVLENVARVNKTQISEKSMQALMSPSSQTDRDEAGNPGLIKTVLRSRVLLRRVCTTPIWWVACTFVYYGLSINSIGLSGNMYLNYIYTCAVEIPGFFSALFTLPIIGRKWTLASGFLLSAGCNFAFAFISIDLVSVRLALFLLGKLFISMVFTSVYLFTSELYPTRYRHTFIGFSSMIGRIGTITAPLTPALAEYWEGIPSVLFGGVALVAGFLALTQPETLGVKLPDTLVEAEALGRSNDSRRLREIN
ncbi:solute carrier family 22 member 7-like [Hyposmocoma kahamanoa]|uniref:solute carrier family 22 member 7-like n=1 Tax=Hyposmocoma kahamanoa TaxID=1477025 RepID=UPI000E6D9848|nr:solute carrier family 22 member 7-like [Hyposmocoma kahamanoa]